jgi:hypothetical protein
MRVESSLSSLPLHKEHLTCSCFDNRRCPNPFSRNRFARKFPVSRLSLLFFFFFASALIVLWLSDCYLPTETKSKPQLGSVDSTCACACCLSVVSCTHVFMNSSCLVISMFTFLVSCTHVLMDVLLPRTLATESTFPFPQMPFQFYNPDPNFLTCTAQNDCAAASFGRTSTVRARAPAPAPFDSLRVCRHPFFLGCIECVSDSQ